MLYYEPRGPDSVTGKIVGKSLTQTEKMVALGLLRLVIGEVVLKKRRYSPLLFLENLVIAAVFRQNTCRSTFQIWNFCAISSEGRKQP